MVSKRDVNSAELETMRTSKSPTTVTTAHGEVQTREEATVYVEEFDLFVTGMLFEETSAVLSLRKLCEDHGYTYHWTSGQKPHLSKKGQENWLQYIILWTIRCPWFIKLWTSRSPLFIYEFLYNTHTYFIDTFITGLNEAKKEVEVWVRSSGETRCINPQKPKTKIKVKDAKKYKAICGKTCRTGCRSWEKIWSMKLVLWSHGETLRLRIKTLPVLLMNYQWSFEQKWNRVRVSIVSTRTFRRTQIAISAWRRK